MTSDLFSLNRLSGRFLKHEGAAVAPTFVLTLIPILVSVGAAIDYSRANSMKAVLQSTLDSAILAGAKDGSSFWSQTATTLFQSNFSQKSAAQLTPTFTQDTDGTYKAAVELWVPTAVLAIARINSLKVTANSAAQASAPDDSCILTLDHGQSRSHISLILNGAPIVNLTGCSIRSNTSLNCNGHDGNVTKGIAAGTASDCGLPKSYAPTVPDMYLDLAKNITTQCGTSKIGVTWSGGS